MLAAARFPARDVFARVRTDVMFREHVQHACTFFTLGDTDLAERLLGQRALEISGGARNPKTFGAAWSTVRRARQRAKPSWSRYRPNVSSSPTIIEPRSAANGLVTARSAPIMEGSSRWAGAALEPAVACVAGVSEAELRCALARGPFRFRDGLPLARPRVCQRESSNEKA